MVGGYDNNETEVSILITNEFSTLDPGNSVNDTNLIFLDLYYQQT